MSEIYEVNFKREREREREREKEYLLVEPRHEKPTFCMYENKGADKLYRASDRRLWFRYLDRTSILLRKSKISSL